MSHPETLSADQKRRIAETLTRINAGLQRAPANRDAEPVHLFDPGPTDEN